MDSLKHVSLVGQFYYYRRKIPHDVLMYFPFKKELKRSLKTSNLRNAKHIVSLYNAEADKLFSRIRSNALNDNEIKKLVSEFTSCVLAQSDEHRLEYGHQVTRLESGFLCSDVPYDEMAETIEDEMMDASFKEIGRIFEEFLYEKNIRLDIERDSTKFKSILRQASVGYIDTLKIDRQRDLGNFEEAVQSSQNPSVAVPVQSAGEGEVSHREDSYKSNIKVSELITRYIENQMTDLNRRNESTIIEREQCCRRFISIAGDKNLSAYTSSDFDEYSSVLSRLPAYVNTKKQFKGKSVQQILAMDYEDTLGVSTRVKHIQTVKNLFDFAVKRELLDKNRALNIDNPVESKSKQKPRIPYSSDDLKKMVDNYHLEYQSKSTFKTRVDWFWIPLIAMFSGMRQNEICQLRVKDVLKESSSGVWYFDVYEEEGETSVKNKSSIRKVPLHPALIELGLIDYYESVKASGSYQLWPKLKANSKGKFSQSIRNWFNGDGGRKIGFRKNYISDDSRKVFHSFRHSLRNELKQVGADKDISFEIVGHEYEEGESGTYTDDYEVSVKLKELEKVTYKGLDLSPLKPLADSYLVKMD